MANIIENKIQAPNNLNQHEEKDKLTPEEAKDAADALLSINNLHTKRSKSGIYIIIFVTTLLLIAIVVLSFTSAKSTNKSSSSNTTLPSNNNPLNNGGSVDSQTKYCSNPVNANLVC